jgi:predicted unusual protein kinase regulating ubiquinone biosynthesis (AarF/ABC1/UbiB family)
VKYLLSKLRIKGKMLTTANPKQLRWQRPKYSPIARQRDVFGAAFQLMVFLWWDNLWQDSSVLTRKRRANWLVSTLLDLGPTFIKIGQSLSTRADILPLEYVQALAQLQDRVPEFDAQEAIEIVEAELGKSLHTLYRDFDRVPIAAASLQSPFTHRRRSCSQGATSWLTRIIRFRFLCDREVAKVFSSLF